MLIGLLGDVMLGRMVGRAVRLEPKGLVAPEVTAVTHEVDLLVANLECCISERGERWPNPSKPFFFRAPPRAVEVLTHLGVDLVTLANNHALDYGTVALGDTLQLLADAGIATVGAGATQESARSMRVLEAHSFRLGAIGFTDHPAEYAATGNRAGVAYADLRHGVPSWLVDAVADADRESDAVLVSAHWGPNMSRRPPAYVRRAARALRDAGATLVAGHSAHVFHGIADGVCFDLGDFLDDYARDVELRNDLGIVVQVEVEASGARSATVVPLALEYCHTRLASGDDAAWILSHMTDACRALGATCVEHDGRLVVDLT